MPPSINYLGVSQIVELKGVSRSAVYQAIESGRLPSERIANHIVVREQDAVAWIPLTPERRKGVRIGGPQSKKEQAVKRAVGRPRKDAQSAISQEG